MRVAVDARSVYQEATLRGVGKTLVELYRSLARARPRWTFDMYYQVWNQRDPFMGFPNVSRRPVDGKGDRFHAWQNFWFPVTARLVGADILHCHGAIAPWLSLNRLVTTIHDLTPLEFQPRDPAVSAWAASVRRGAQQARRVLTCSEYTRRQVNRVFGIPLKKITTIYWGANKTSVLSASSDGLAAARTRYGLAPDLPYALHFGMTKPRKNTRRLLEAWARLPSEVQSCSALLVVGLEPDGIGQFRALARALGIAGSCHLHGYLPESDVSTLLSGATILCYLSLSEGFGLPILDAFARDTAVLCSNTTSLPEVAGDAAVLVDPTNADAIARGLVLLFRDKATRAELIARGRVQLSRFSWQQCAEQVADILAAA